MDNFKNSYKMPLKLKVVSLNALYSVSIIVLESFSPFLLPSLFLVIHVHVAISLCCLLPKCLLIPTTLPLLTSLIQALIIPHGC